MNGTNSSSRGCDSFYDNPANDPGFSDDTAIATDKIPLLPGQRATFANFTSYSRGINGVMVDIAGLPQGADLTADDFEFKVGNDSDPAGWAAGPAPSVSVRRGAGTSGSDRVTLVWPDNAVRQTWLQVTVRSNASTGLQEPDVFYFGNAVGETGNLTGGATGAAVNSQDVIRTRNSQFGAAPIDSPYDFNRSGGIINSSDLILCRNNQFFTLQLTTAPAGEWWQVRTVGPFTHPIENINMAEALLAARPTTGSGRFDVINFTDGVDDG